MNADARSLRERLFIAMQHLLPQHLLSRLTGVLARSGFQPLKDWLIRRFIAHFAVDMSEAAEPDPGAYPHFNAFFTRALREGMRPVDAAPRAITSPADGAVSQLGAIEDGRMFQAKGHWFSAAELLADPADARLFANGSFATIYLSPRDYHRVHMPLAGRLRALRYVPGKLFSVNQVTAESVPGLFARNERLVCLFDTEHGPLAMVLVGRDGGRGHRDRVDRPGDAGRPARVQRGLPAGRRRAHAAEGCRDGPLPAGLHGDPAAAARRRELGRGARRGLAAAHGAADRVAVALTHMTPDAQRRRHACGKCAILLRRSHAGSPARTRREYIPVGSTVAIQATDGPRKTARMAPAALVVRHCS
jgi:phosphatidylserine decarboxylase